MLNKQDISTCWLIHFSVPQLYNKCLVKLFRTREINFCFKCTFNQTDCLYGLKLFAKKKKIFTEQEKPAFEQQQYSSLNKNLHAHWYKEHTEEQRTLYIYRKKAPQNKALIFTDPQKMLSNMLWFSQT